MVLEQRMPLAVLCNLIATASLIAWKFDETSAIERPFHLAIGVFLLLGLSWSVLAWLQRNHNGDNLSRRQDGYELTSSSSPHADRSASPRRAPIQLAWDIRRVCDIRKSIGTVIYACIRLEPTALLVAGVVLRVIVSRAIMQEVQCSASGIEIFLPFLLSLYEAIFDNRRPLSPQPIAVSKMARSYSIRYALILGIWCAAAYASSTMSAQRSTYICPVVGFQSKSVPILQVLGLLLDAFILINYSKVSNEASEFGRSNLLLATLSFISAGVLSIMAGIFILKNPEHMIWSFHLDSRIIYDLIVAIFLSSSFIASVAYLMGELHGSVPITVANWATVYTSQFSTSSVDFLPGLRQSSLVVSLIAFGSSAVIMRLWREASRNQRMALSGACSKALTAIFVLATILFFGTKYSLFTHERKWADHPISLLMSNARHSSDKWQRQAKISRSLEEAVVEYQSRYGIPPPPNFDKWYEFATSRGSLIIDDFGQIHNDLLPFWGVEPAKIREMTGHMLERPWIEVGGLSIFNSSVHIGPHVPGTHRWSMDGATAMIDKFVEWLPDMDIAININDEPRAITPWNTMADLNRRGELARRQLNRTKALSSFSQNTHDSWPGAFLEPEPAFSFDTESLYFVQASIAPSFTKFEVLACPPDSLSRTASWWEKQSFCQHCASPHSMGQFISNWTLSGSLCHQPDLANLHGIHISPSSFKPTTSLFPIFSQSKVAGYSDIVFPSPWNYQDKVFYDEARDKPFSEKEKSVFWRGATSEGFAVAGNWKGMQRQRFVNLVNHTP
ncbi:Beta-1,2-xylosyltransferase, partial [Lachnellula suecica]